MPFAIPEIASMLDGRGFLRGVGSILSIVPPDREPLPALPPAADDETAVARVWQQVGDDLRYALGQARPAKVDHDV